LAEVGDAQAHNLLSTQSVAASNGRPHIYLYIIQVLYYLTFGDGLRGWWGLLCEWNTWSESDGRRENFIKLCNNLHASIYSKSGVHRPCLVLFGNNVS
jgi:hypothetical protein